MVNIKEYLNDGANWQARGVLAYILGNYETELYTPLCVVNIKVGRFENCREQGYVFTLYDSQRLKQLMHYAVYEHRNSDSLCVLKQKLNAINTPSVNDMFGERGKYGYDASFECGGIKDCGEWILSDMWRVLDYYIKENDIHD